MWTTNLSAFVPAIPPPSQLFVGCWYYPSASTWQGQNPFARQQSQQQQKTLYPVPLQNVEVKGRVLDLIAEVEISHHYVNKEEQPIEAIYNFPIENKAAICGFEAFIDGKKIVAEIQEKEEAINSYDDAISSGHGAYLLEQKSDEIFTANIGNLPPGKEVKVTIRYITELSMEDNALKFVLPTTIAPRYDPTQYFTQPKNPFGNGFDKQEESQSAVSYELSFELEFEMFCKITGMGSPSHNIDMTFDENKAQVRLALGKTSLDKDVVVKVQLSHPNHPRCWVEQDQEGTKTAMMAFYPKIDCPDPKSEIVFVVDRSGSMGGSKIDAAKQTLQLFLRSLPESCIFQIISFGSRFTKLFPMSAPYNDDTLKRATAHVADFRADYGGTELLQPLEAVLSEEANKGYPRQIFILTDGEVENTEKVVSFVGKHANTTRVFTFGIGAGVSQQLCRDLAEAGSGEAEFVSDGGGQDLQLKVCRQLKKALQPAITSLGMDWGGLIAKQAPAALPPLFNGGRLLVYAFLGEQRSHDNVFKVTLQGEGPYGPVSFPLEVDVANVRGGVFLSRLAARSLIRDLERSDSSSEDIKEPIVALSKKYTLASKFASFVAVEERKEATFDTMQSRKVPITLNKAWASRPQTGFAFGSGGQQTFGCTPTPQGFSGGSIWGAAPTPSLWGGGSPFGGTAPTPSPWGGSSPFGGADTSTFSFGNSAPTSQGLGGSAFGASPFGTTGQPAAGFPTTPIMMPAPSFASASVPTPHMSHAFWSSQSVPAPLYFHSHQHHQSQQQHRDNFVLSQPTSAPPISRPQQQVSHQQKVDTASLDAVIRLQNANGSWEFNEALAGAVGTSLSKLRDGMRKISVGSVPETVWAAAVAVAFLASHFAALSDMWTLIADKAQKYALKEVSVEAWASLVATAKSILA